MPRAAVAASFLFFALLLLPRVARAAETWELPIGGRRVALPDGRVACAPPASDFTFDADARGVTPPASEEAVGRAVTIALAADKDACATAGATTPLTLVVVGRTPNVDPASVSLAVDDARLELRGKNLKGAVVRWQAGARSGDDRCVQTVADPAGERCTIPVARGLPADPTLPAILVLPAGARLDDTAVLFDAGGRRVAREELTWRVARVLLATVAPAGASIDLAGGSGSRIPLAHPEAVTSADCASAACRVDGNAVVVTAVSSLGSAVVVRLHLAPRVFVAHGDVLDPAPTLEVPVLQCPMSIASGPPIRDVEDGRVVVKIDARCAGDAPNLRFFAQGRALDVLDSLEDGGAAYVLLRAGRVEGDELAITASRTTSPDAVVGAARAHTRAAPTPRASLELPGTGPVDFVPTNRPATVRFARDLAPGVLHVLPVEGVYDVTATSAGPAVVGEEDASGFVSLRFGVVVPSLPGKLGQTDLAVLTEPLARPMHEANVPVALGASAMGSAPLVELVCGASRIMPGAQTNIPFDARDSCRLVFHRERISREDGAQSLSLDIDVQRVDGTPRPEAHVSQPITLRAAKTPRFAWVRGVAGPFDRVTIHLSHVADESHYVGGSELKTGAPAAQWSVVTGTGKARLYATTSIPTGLYRVSDKAHSGILTLNFGVIARLTWLDSEGHEGFLGVEGGVMGMGLANDVSLEGHSLTQVATVTGLGLSVPIANRSLATETSINLHAWFEYEISRDLGDQPGSPLGFVFGPSISIGNIGTNL